MKNKYISKVCFWVLSAIFIQLVYTSCKEDEELAYITLVGNTVVDLGDKSQLMALVDATEGSLVSVAIQWTSSNPEVAIVDQTGLVRSLTVGRTVVKASLPNGKGTMVEISVNQPASISIPVTDYYFVSNGYGSDSTITATLMPEKLVGAEKIVWVSSDPDVAEIMKIDTLEAMRKEKKSYAVIKPKKKGVALITVSNGSKRREFKIHVGTVITQLGWYLKDNRPSTPSASLIINVGTDSLLTGYYQFRASDASEGWRDLDFQWSIEPGKENILEVVGEPATDYNVAYFKVRAKAEGKAKITLMVAGQKMVAICKVRDINKIPVDSIKINQTTARQKSGGVMLLLAAKAYPLGVVTAWPVKWSSSDPEIATVNQNGEVITGKKTGKVMITAQSSAKLATCEVTVFHAISQLIINSNSNTAVMLGNKELWTASSLPVALDLQNMGWKSSNESVAKVDANGYVTAVGLGIAEITANCTSETETEGGKVEVVSAPRRISVMPLEGSAMLDESEFWDDGNYVVYNGSTRTFEFLINYELAGYQFTSRLTNGKALQDGIYEIGADLKEAVLSWIKDDGSSVSANVSSGTIEITRQGGQVKLELDLTMMVGAEKLTVKGRTPYFTSSNPF